MYVIDDALKELLDIGVAATVATADTDGRPHMVAAWGPLIHDDRSTVSVFLEQARADATLENLQANGKIALTVADPVSYRSVQLKGIYLGRGEADEDDQRWVQARREAFMVATALVGEPPATARNRWMDPVLRVDFRVERAFDQTPGPDAGKPL
jgi:hypothetical protein